MARFSRCLACSPIILACLKSTQICRMPTMTKRPLKAQTPLSAQSFVTDTGGSSRTLTDCGASWCFGVLLALSSGLTATGTATEGEGLIGVLLSLASLGTAWAALVALSVAFCGAGEGVCGVAKNRTRIMRFMSD